MKTRLWIFIFALKLVIKSCYSHLSSSNNNFHIQHGEQNDHHHDHVENKDDNRVLDYGFSDQSKQILINKLKKKLQIHINDLIFQNNKSNIHQNHVEFLRLRNVECPKEFAKIDDVMISSKNSSLFTKSLEKWAAFSEDLKRGFEDEIVDDLNKIVID